MQKQILFTENEQRPKLTDKRAVVEMTYTTTHQVFIESNLLAHLDNVKRLNESSGMENRSMKLTISKTNVPYMTCYNGVLETII